MKNIVKLVSILAVSGAAVCGCIKETFPQGSTVTADQIAESSSALQASLNGIPSQMAQGYLIYGDQVSELDMGIPGIFMALSECTGELYPLGDAGYDHFQRYNTCQSVGKTTYRSYVPWRTLYILVKSANDVIAATNEAEGAKLLYRGQALAYRAYFYWMLMNMYEPVANEYTDCSTVLGLTVPKVTEETTEDQARNNPRVKHDEMIEFILGDLAEAGDCMEEAAEVGEVTSSKLFPSEAVVYGLTARVLMTAGSAALDEGEETAAMGYFKEAAEAAQSAIDAAGCTPLTQSQWEDVNTGFNTENSAWMWKISYAAENMGNLCNWIGWISAEADWGYASLTGPGIDKKLYDQIPDTDFRKHSWLDPDKFDYCEQFEDWAGYKSCRGEDWITEAPSYTSIKFRPVGGDYETYSIGGVADVPLMRIEEMYYIKAEALGMQVLQQGKDALEDFVKAYRQSDYSCTASDKDAFQKEILFQKKIEFWGEGIAFFDAKRMKAGCEQSYVGTNAPGDNFKLNCNIIKPDWNFVIPETEESSNSGIVGFNNPDPSGSVTPTL